MLTEAFIRLMEPDILNREVDGVALHVAFFLEPKSFCRALREMAPDRIARIQMKPASFTNELYGDEEAKRRARIDARFVNNALMATLMEAAVSDGLEDGQVVSGVGGQYNSVAQAFALQGARSLLTVEATQRAGAKVHSNIRWAYGHQTIPRHLRDVTITEYGVADLRGKSDADVIAATLAVAYSRFQADLARQAKDAGKLPKNFEIPPDKRENFPERIKAALKRRAKRVCLEESHKLNSRRHGERRDDERDVLYLFLFTGLRFSMNAAMPSERSSSAKVEWNRLRSTFMPSASGVSKARLMASLAMAAAGRDIAAIFSAAASASAISLSAGTTRLTRPERSASAASIIRPVRQRSIALDLPTARVSRCVPPMPGIVPSVISG